MSGAVEGVALLPCPNPWCESHADGALPNENDIWQHPGFAPAYRVQCSFCLMEGPVKEGEDEAIAAWNTRTTPPARSYADGVEDAAKVCDERAAGRTRMYEDNHAGINAFKAVEAEEAAAAIRLLSQGGKA